MICPKCHNPVPDGKIACTCFIRHAEQEKRDLAVKRFKDHQVLLFVRKGHVFPERSRCVSLCGTFPIDTKDADHTDQIEFGKVSPDNLAAVTCEACHSFIG